MWYYTLGNEEDSAALIALFEAVAERQLEVGDIWKLLTKFGWRVKKAVAADEPPDFGEFLTDEGFLPNSGCDDASGGGGGGGSGDA